MARDPSPARATPALAALAELDDPAVLPVLRAALIREDPGILAAATTAIAVRSVDAAKRDLEVVPLLEDIVRTRTEAAAFEARLAAIEALGALARSTLAALDPDGNHPSTGAAGDSPWLARTILPLAQDPAVAVRQTARGAILGHEQLLRAFDERAARVGAQALVGDPGDGPRPRAPFGERLAADLQQQLDEPARGLRIQTTAGSFTLEFTGISAPYNQANLAALATAGFYDGLSFHRVVPGFVVQGGDPRGDGYGGPGYLVPCERSNLRYERGTVGMALAGKDSGGSQFFITQTPQPHLDARYTVIGQVVEGMEVVDLLLPGDRIEAVEVLRP
nr:peptidylprolyl isomerase [Pseudenhygromyxa sp. WMMC2535]